MKNNASGTSMKEEVSEDINSDINLAINWTSGGKL